MTYLYQRFMELSRHPKFADLDSIISVLKKGITIRPLKDGLVVSANVRVDDVVTQLQEDFQEKLERVKEGNFVNYSVDYDRTLFRTKERIFDEIPNGSKDKREKAFNFLLDFTIMASLFEYPLVFAKVPGFGGRRAAEISHLIATYYAAESCIPILNIGHSKKSNGGGLGSCLMKLVKPLGQEIKGALVLEDLDSLVSKYNRNGKLNTIRTMIGLIPKQNGPGWTQKKRLFRRLVTPILEKADVIYDISQKNHLLAHLYDELFAATVPGYKSKFSPAFFSLYERRAEKNMPIVRDTLFSVIGKAVSRRSGFQFIYDFKSLMERSTVFAHQQPEHVKKVRLGHNNTASFVYIPLTNKKDNIITYFPTKVYEYLNRNGFLADGDGITEASLLKQDSGAYVARARQDSNTYFTGYVDKVQTGRVAMKEKPDFVFGVSMPLRYAVFSGSSYGEIFDEAERFEEFFERNDIVAAVLDTKDLKTVLTKGFGLRRAEIEQLEKVGALSRASPVFDLVAQYVTAHPQKYVVVGSQK